MIMDAPKELSIEAKNISYEIDGKLIIDNFSYVFKPGNLYVMVGESGCGKTTLLSMLAGYLKPTEGSVILSKDIKKNISFYSESGACFFDLTVYQNLKMFSKDNDCIEEVLSLVDLQDKKNQKTNTLSKGEIARLALARMILCDSRVMLFDEPTTNLDIENRRKFFSILRYMSKSKIVIVANHDLSLINKEDIVLKNNGNHSFEQFQSIEEANYRYDITYPYVKENDIKKRISIADCFMFIKNIFKRSIKQLVILIPIFFLLFFAFTSSTAFISKTGNEMFYDMLTSSNINGMVIQETEIDDDLVFDGILSNINDNEECVLLLTDDKSSITINNSKFTLESEKEAIIPSSYAKQFNLNIGDCFNILISDEEKEFFVSNIYKYNEIVTDGYLSNVAEDKLSNIRMNNQPIIIKSQVIAVNEINNSFKYALTDYFKKDKSLEHNNYILDCLDPSMFDIIVNKKSFNVPYFYFFWISLGLIIVSLYFYSIFTIKALQNDLLIFKLTKNKIVDPIVAASLGGLLYLFCIAGLSLIFSAIFFPLINGLISRFYLLNATIDFLSVSTVIIVSSLILLMACTILLVVLLIVFGHIKIHKKINRLE